MKAFKYTSEIMANCYICSLQKLIMGKHHQRVRSEKGGSDCFEQNR